MKIILVLVLCQTSKHEFPADACNELIVGEEKSEDGIWRTNNFALGCAGPRSNNGLFVQMSRYIL